MTDLAISADGIGKRYRLGELQRYTALRELLEDAVTAPFRKLRRRRAAARVVDEEQHIWALRDVSFEVRPGEVVGIIGRNGAGKSTLLKVLARITQPTEGTAQICGSVGSLLEIGTGFHPELTGRENIYLNGAILGMRRAEMDRKFNEIVEFAGIEEFIETPVKRFSSGMYIRLAFGVAAHLNPDILLVDEVLAVGDIEFQKRCMGRMEDVGHQGRTVVFVSHSMQSVLRLCPRVILLDRGKVVADGPARQVIRTYLESGLGTSAAREWPSPQDAPGDEIARLKSVRVLDRGEEPSEEIDIRHPIEIEVEFWLRRPVAADGPGVALVFRNENDVTLFASTDFNDRDFHGRPHEPGVVRSVCRIPGNFLAEGEIFVEAVVASQKPPTLHLVERDAVAFHVVDRSVGDGVRGQLTFDWPGVVRPMLDWSIEMDPSADSLSDLSSSLP